MRLREKMERWDVIEIHLRELRKTGVTYAEINDLVKKICDEIPLEEEKR